MDYARPTIYPDGTSIPNALPASYQPAGLGNAPAGQSCSTCKHYNAINGMCDAWLAKVRADYWCKAWIPKILKQSLNNLKESKMYKKVTHKIVEEHFNHPLGIAIKAKYDDYLPENEEDVIKVDVPLLIRLLEWAREDAQKDCDLHIIAEKLIELSEDGDVLEMKDYPEIIQYKQED